MVLCCAEGVMLRDEDEDGRVEVLIALWGALALALALACVRGTSGVGEAPRWRSGSWTDRCVTSVDGFGARYVPDGWVAQNRFSGDDDWLVGFWAEVFEERGLGTRVIYVTWS
jgi:hypothetical protein